MRSAHRHRASRSLTRRLRRPEPHRLARALAGCGLLTLAAAPAAAQTAPVLPSGLAVAAGAATVATSGNRMTVTNTPQAILNWNSFSIGSNAAVHFQQAAPTSAVLNRVTGSDASNILGSLSSNGRVWLLNPNGILFGQGARVDVAGLVASTLRLSDVDWLSGRWNLSGSAGSTASVVNQGELRTSFGGTVALAGGSVDNAGLVEAPGGQIVLAAGHSVELVDTGAPNLAVRISAPAGEARNLGALQAAGGRIDIHAAAVNQQGIVSADALASGPGGEVWIKAAGAIELAAGSRTSAAGGTGDNSHGGTVHVESDAGRTSVRGAVGAQAAGGTGGQVVLLGREVGVFGNARIDASGAAAGGEVLVGGGERGADPRYANARAVYVSPQASLAADATAQGDGGRIVLWSDAATRAFGSFSVRGGPNGGDGGFVETSGGWLDARPALVDTHAPRGQAGRWLLDPYDILISDFLDDRGYDTSFTANSASATISAGTLQNALNAGTSVTVSTGGPGGGSQAGNITLANANIFTTSSAPGNLTLIADGGITMTTSRISALAGPQVVTLRAGRGGAGPVILNNSTIDVSGEFGEGGSPLPGTRGIVIGGFASGELPLAGSFGGAAGGSASTGVTLDNSVLSAGRAGNVTISAIAGRGAGITLVNASALVGYDVELRGDSSDTTGVAVLNSTIVAGHRLLLRGVGQGVGTFLGDNAQLSLDPSNAGDASNALLLQGRGRRASDFVSVAIDGGESATLQALGGAPVTVEAVRNGSVGGYLFIGESDAGSQAIDAAGGGLVTLRADGSGAAGAPGNGRVAILGATIDAGTAGIDIDTPGSLTLSGSIDSAGRVRLSAFEVDLLSGASVSSTAFGTAIIVAGPDDGGSRQLVDLAVEDSSVQLSTSSGGRWIVYATELTAVNEAARRLLDHDFRLHDAAYGDWAGYAGNGLVFGDPITANYRGTLTTRAYDGTLTARVASASAEGEFGDLGTLAAGTVNAVYANKNAGTNKPATFATPDAAFAFRDTDGRPVYGYTLAGTLTGTVTPANVIVPVSVADKVYDAGTVAQVTVGALSGLVGSETLGVSATGRFADKNVGTGKEVLPTYTLADGANGGLAANYQFIGPLTLTASITPRPIGISGVTANNKVYDRTTAATVTGSATVTPLAGDNLVLAGSAAYSFADRNVGSAKPVTVASLRLAGNDANNYTLLASTLSASITPRPYAVSGLSALGKTYDATTTATLSGSAVGAAISGDQVVLSATSGATARFADKNVGTAKPVTVTGFTLSGADAGNYAVVQPTGLAASIAPLAVTVRGVTATDKVYDAGTAATLGGGALVATLLGDAVTLAGSPAATFADKNVGTSKPVTVSGYRLQGSDAGNYSLLQPAGLSAAITPRPVTLTGLSAADKVYDGTTAATLSGSPALAVLPGDAVTLTGSATAARFADKNAGVDKPVSVTGLGLAGADAANYTLSQPTGLVADITPRPLAFNLAAQDKVYDGTTAATLSVSSVTPPLAGDDVTVTGGGTARFADKNAGVDKPVIADPYGLAGADAANYTLSQTTGLVADITPRALTLSGLSVADKVYDGTTAAGFSGSPVLAILTGDLVTLTGTATAARFADRNVGVDKPVSVAGLGLAGVDAANYTLSQPTGLVADITARPITLTGLSVADKVYDGTTTASLAGNPLLSVLTGDAVTLTGSAGAARFADKNVGVDKPVSVAGLGLAGADAANYTLSQPTGLVADITPLAVTLSGLTAADKVYDGGTAATLVGSASVATLAGDAVLVAGAPVARFADKNAGIAKPVGVGGYALNGADAANYSLSQPTGLAARITPRPVALTGLTAADKVYDGSTAAPLVGIPAVATLAGDSVTLAGTPVASFADANVGAAKPVAIGGVTLAGADAANYRYDGAATAFAGITPATLRYTAAPAVRGRGAPLDGFAGQVGGFVGGDSATTATSGTLSFATPAAAGSPPGRYALLGGGLAAANYRFEQAPDNAAALSIVDLSPSVAEVVATETNRVDTLLQRALPLAIDRSPADSRVLVAIAPAAAPLSAAVAGLPAASFAPVALASLSPGAIQQLLDSRAIYMRTVLADATTKLEDNPNIADLTECETAAEALRGTCLLTAKAKSRLAGAPAVSGEAAQPPSSPSVAGGTVAGGAGGAAPSTAPPATPTPAPSTAGTPAPAAAQTTPPPQTAAAQPAAPLPAIDDTASQRRRVRSAALPQIDRKIALVIGVDRYADPAIPSLANAVRDARAIGKVFEDKLGYEVVTVADATRPKVVAALNQLALTLGPRDSVVVYYAGHGDLVEATGMGYWLLADSVAKQPETWLSNADISRSIAQMGALQVALVSDSCYSGSLVSEERIRAAPASLDPQAVLGRKSVVVMSSGGNEPVFDEGKDGHSPFAWNLMNTLSNVASWQAGGNVFERVRFAVARALPQRPQYSASRAGGHQTGGDYLFEQRQLEGERR